jgi:hypothetical protein
LQIDKKVTEEKELVKRLTDRTQTIEEIQERRKVYSSLSKFEICTFLYRIIFKWLRIREID